MTINEPSRGEKKVMDLLRHGGLRFEREVSFEGLVGKKKVPLRFDFAVYNQKGEPLVLIDFDGEQHFKYVKYFHKTISGFKRAQERDRIKNKYCLKHNIPLIRIPFWDLEELTLNKIFGTAEYRVENIYHNDYLARQLEVRR